MRLIDADALKKEYLDKFWKACEDEDERFDAIGTMAKIIDEAPTVSASEVYVYLQDGAKWLDKYIGKKESEEE